MAQVPSVSASSSAAASHAEQKRQVAGKLREPCAPVSQPVPAFIQPHGFSVRPYLMTLPHEFHEISSWLPLGLPGGFPVRITFEQGPGIHQGLLGSTRFLPASAAHLSALCGHLTAPLVSKTPLADQVLPNGRCYGRADRCQAGNRDLVSCLQRTLQNAGASGPIHSYQHDNHLFRQPVVSSLPQGLLDLLKDGIASVGGNRSRRAISPPCVGGFCAVSRTA